MTRRDACAVAAGVALGAGVCAAALSLHGRGEAASLWCAAVALAALVSLVWLLGDDRRPPRYLESHTTTGGAYRSATLRIEREREADEDDEPDPSREVSAIAVLGAVLAGALTGAWRVSLCVGGLALVAFSVTWTFWREGRR